LISKENIANKLKQQMTNKYKIYTIPNVLTFIRILCVPFVVNALLADKFQLALIIFIIGALTDFFDGVIARLTKSRSRLGRYLDPIADKIFAISIAFTLLHIGLLKMFLFILFFAREFIILTGSYVLYKKKIFNVPPSIVGKLNTVLQFLLIFIILLLKVYNIENFKYMIFLEFLVSVTTVISGVLYYREGNRRLSRYK
jgi:cardiolipin synthase (CMP-forming)